jgi:hypothetical protein
VRFWCAIAAMGMLSACASYPPLSVGGAPRPAQPSSTPEVDASLAEAARLQAIYASNYQRSAKTADWSQLPIIGAAAAAAWVLLVDKPSAATTAGKIGIGAGAYAAGRGQLIGEGLVDAYLAGHSALTCVLSQGSNFSGTTAQATHAQLDSQLQIVADRIATLNFAARQTPQTIDGKGDVLRAAQAAADAAMTQASDAVRTALSEQAAYSAADPVFRNAVASISVRVASKGRVRPPIDFASLRDGLAPAKAGTATRPNGLGTPSVDQVIGDIQVKTTELLSQTMVLVSLTRPYRQSLERVAACPDQIR